MKLIPTLLILIITFGSSQFLKSYDCGYNTSLKAWKILWMEEPGSLTFSLYDYGHVTFTTLRFHFLNYKMACDETFSSEKYHKSTNINP